MEMVNERSISAFTHLIDLAAERFGGQVLWCTDDFFAEKENLIKPSKPVFITDKYTGQAKGFGFVEMASDAETTAAINALNGTLMGGRNLTVNEAKPREERPRKEGGGGYNSGRDRW